MVRIVWLVWLFANGLGVNSVGICYLDLFIFVDLFGCLLRIVSECGFFLCVFACLRLLVGCCIAYDLWVCSLVVCDW